ncbi:MAG: PEP-CTERM sorting domain-containing protein [Prevotella sp.]|nr:PEP-CTERM sorting domain-containing protein [Prevotella sp.]
MPGPKVLANVPKAIILPLPVTNGVPEPSTTILLLVVQFVVFILVRSFLFSLSTVNVTLGMSIWFLPIITRSSFAWPLPILLSFAV